MFALHVLPMDMLTKMASVLAIQDTLSTKLPGNAIWVVWLMPTGIYTALVFVMMDTICKIINVFLKATAKTVSSGTAQLVSVQSVRLLIQ